jgi:uncharacterized protein
MTTSAFSVIAKPVGARCNLDCAYCFYVGKTEASRGCVSPVMSDQVLEALVRGYLAQDAPVVSFVWQGGEPTLAGLGFFRKVVALQQRYGGGRKVENTLQTNGVLLDAEWAAFLAEHGFLVGLSIDGPAQLHNRYRVDRGGKPTFAAVLRALDLLLRHSVQFNTLTVVHRQNAREPRQVYRFLKATGSRFLQFIPLVERVVPGTCADNRRLAGPGSACDARVASWSTGPAEWGRFLCSIFDEWVREDVGSVFVQLFDVALESWYMGQPRLCVFQETCGRALAVEQNGDVFACDHYVFPAHRRGNLLDRPLASLVEDDAQSAFGRGKLDLLPGECRECPVLFACRGGCPKDRFARSADGRHALNYLCAGYRAFFTHIEPYMRFMANELRHERPPANIMSALRTGAGWDAQVRHGKT